MDNIIAGNPTKTFFIEMITRDISIKDAIIDLIDNSIDGANRINSENYGDRKVDISLSKDSFIVLDNCGGFSLETATKYAFRFGRPEDAPLNTGSVGRFGIGMKRALFKMGKNFIVESKHRDEHFEVAVDVEKWKSQTRVKSYEGKNITEDDWSFSYQVPQNGILESDGTYIKVTNLNGEVSSLFSQETFIQSLINDIERILNFSIEKGVEIIINGVKLSRKNIQLFWDENMKPFVEYGTHHDTRYRVIAGISKTGEPSSAGWYIYCNDRLVVEADKSEQCGWGTYGVPKWHVDYAMFRGIVFIDAEDTIQLPLTTTKKGIDSTSEVYVKILSTMKVAMSKVMNYLKQISKLNDAQDFRILLADTTSSISVVDLKRMDMVENLKFIAPEANSTNLSEQDEFVHITYSVEKELALRAKQYANVRSYSELGKLAFDYYVNMEELNTNG